MMIMARDRDYPELVEGLRGRHVLIWSCTTCARLCGVTGRDGAEGLAERLREDGIDVVGTASTSAACLMPKVAERMPSGPGYDTVLALTCAIGASCASSHSGAEVVNPVETFGYGYMDDSGEPVAMLSDGDRPLSAVSSRSGPFL
jgi:hypothetical protein